VPAANPAKLEMGHSMFAQINHIAMISQQNTLLQRYYQSLFGLQASENNRGKFVFGGAAGDGRVGFNFCPTATAMWAGSTISVWSSIASRRPRTA
jgi:hypothetical protein